MLRTHYSQLFLHRSCCLRVFFSPAQDKFTVRCVGVEIYRCSHGKAYLSNRNVTFWKHRLSPVQSVRGRNVEANDSVINRMTDAIYFFQRKTIFVSHLDSTTSYSIYSNSRDHFTSKQKYVFLYIYHVCVIRFFFP